MSKAAGVGLAILGAVLVAVYIRYIRPWQLRWGATGDEVARSMPGDDVVKHPSFNATRAVTIRARPEEIWPWLLQIGIRRAGWYSYDWIDNLGIPSANRIIPQLQHVAVGDLIPMSPVGNMGHWVKAFEPNQWMLWGDTKGDVTWCWGLYPLDATRTRLITRVRLDYRWTSPTILFNVLLDVGDIVMMRKCMLGIKQRAERIHDQSVRARGAYPSSGIRPHPLEGGSAALGSLVSRPRCSDPVADWFYSTDQGSFDERQVVERIDSSSSPR